MDQQQILSVSQITHQIKEVLETGFGNLFVEGEISNFKHHSSGHLYFTLKDTNSQISCVMWRARVNRLLFRPADGMKIIARGNITVYEPRGNYQLDCVSIQPAGIGELQQAYERLKKKLLDEGLFERERKKPIPEYPTRIGVVTSPTGAAIQDILSVLSRRMPSVEVILIPVKVQGIGAAEAIAAAIDTLNEYSLIDVMIVGRGGGSLEDLWAFNEEIVARSIFRSRIPVISAVGHEIDFSISDFVADLRAPTPSAAAELVVRDKNELIELIRNISYTLNNSMKNSVVSYQQAVKNLITSYSFHRPHDVLRQRNQQVDEQQRRLQQSVSHHLEMIKHRTEAMNARIHSLDPKMVLKRGYTIVRQKDVIVSGIDSLTVDTDATLEFHDGLARTTVRAKEKFNNGKKGK